MIMSLCRLAPLDFFSSDEVYLVAEKERELGTKEERKEVLVT